MSGDRTPGGALCTFCAIRATLAVVEAVLGGVPRPVERSTAIGYAVVLLDILAAAAVTGAVWAIVALGERDGNWLGAALTVTGTLVVAVGLVRLGRDLGRRRLGAWKVAIAINALVTLAGTVGLVLILVGAGPTGEAALVWFVVLVATVALSAFAVVSLATRTTRDRLRPPEAGWYEDPTTGHWRWWDGARWTSHTV